MEKLNILWTTTNKETISHMLSMYATNALKMGWWEEVNVIIWGGSAKLVGEDPKTQNLVKGMIDNGVKIEACKACCDAYKVAETVENLGVDVKYMGKPLTNYLKNDEKMLTL